MPLDTLFLLLLTRNLEMTEQEILSVLRFAVKELSTPNRDENDPYLLIDTETGLPPELSGETFPDTAIIMNDEQESIVRTLLTSYQESLS